MRPPKTQLDSCLRKGFLQTGFGSTAIPVVLLWLLGRIPFTKLFAIGTASLTDTSLLVSRVTPGASPVNSSSWSLVRAAWASRWENITVILRILMIIVSWRLILLMRIPWALSAALMLAFLADLDAGWELSLAVMAGTANTHADGSADQVLTTGTAWDGEFVLVLVALLMAILVTMTVLVLWLLCWEARTGLASSVLALGASLVSTKGGSAAMAVAMDSHANLLVNTFTLWWLSSETPVGWVDL